MLAGAKLYAKTGRRQSAVNRHSDLFFLNIACR